MRNLKNRFAFMEGNLTILTIRQVVGMFFRRMVLTYASLFVLAVGGSSSQIGVINSLRPLAGLLMFPIAGYLTDRTSRVRIIVLADILSGVSMLLYVLAPSWEWIAVGALVQGFMVFSFPPTSAILADSMKPENRGLGVATMGTISNAISMFSPYIAATILIMFGENIGMRLLYGMLGLQFLFAAVLAFKKLEDTNEINNSEPMPSVFTILMNTYGGVPGLLRDTPRSVVALGVVVLMGFISNGISSPFWVVYVTEKIGLSKIEWGVILLYESILKVVLTIPSGMVADKVGRTKTLIVAMIVSLVSLPALIFADSYNSVLLIRLGAALAGALFMPASTALMADYVPRNLRGKVMAAFGRGSVMIGASGGGTGGPGMGYLFVLPVMASSIVGGVLYNMNPVYPWYAVGIATVVQLICVLLFIRDPEKAQN
ncbi:MFS transporter [Candidatus Bathyarchaeota archaeon]|jgi:MFS transporter, DHA1 family, tetracycline resistance protein|nr:MFS transporter [Candidatus Bathyarchaeota archaeon]MBT4320398.1 MFS transporter [Candidatus Bathyarchaeota archaeon]MBT4423759.1 MFS transporter [Candidatus Bathyarchaeota archaeon]MBT6603596.1 MFS transporter [Candidatus Bathyarchaeota archaeon]MBT7186835.1 MFS transporter [Candidatus Bathyarchaeota archaeon]